MARIRISLWAILLAAICASTSAWSIPPGLLFDRQSTCAENYTECGQGLPSDFCCATGAVCLSLAGNTTALCCPEGQDCSKIAPITCDLSQQNVQDHPESPVKTTALNGVLSHCGSGTCCPFGYSCNSGGDCVIDTNQNVAPLQTSTATTTAPQASQTETPTNTASGDSGTISTSAADAGAQSTGNPEATVVPDSGGGGSKTGVIVGAIFAAGLGALLIVLAIWLWCRRRRREIQARRTSVKSSGTERSWGNTGPLPQPSPRSSPRRIRPDQIRGPELTEIQRSDFAAVRGRSSAGSDFTTAAVLGMPGSTSRNDEAAMAGIRPLRLPQKHGLSPDNSRDSAPYPRAASSERVTSGMTIPIGLQGARVSHMSTATDWGGLMRQAGEETPPMPRDARTADGAVFESPSRRR